MTEHDSTDREELREQAELLAEIGERADLLVRIQRLENDAEWTVLGELRERAALLTDIARAENETADRTDLEGLKEHAALLTDIVRGIDEFKERVNSILDRFRERVGLLGKLAQ